MISVSIHDINLVVKKQPCDRCRLRVHETTIPPSGGGVVVYLTIFFLVALLTQPLLAFMRCHLMTFTLFAAGHSASFRKRY